MFHTNSCALAYVLGQPDRFGIFGGEVCRVRNHCPDAQRHRCAAATLGRPALTDATVRAALDQRGHADARFNIDHAHGLVVIDATLSTATAAALTQDLGARVHVMRHDSDPYWSSGTAGAIPLIIG